MKLISCNSNQPLAEDIARYLKTPLTKATIRHFADNEIFVEILENVRGEDVFVIQSTSWPANDHLMELLITMDALKRGSARRITACLPYFGYARQDRKTGPRSPISAKLVADILTTAGANRVLTLDLHAGQIQGFFNIPVDNLFATPLLGKDIQENLPVEGLLVVSPDVGGVVRARSLAKRLSCGLALIDKRREKPGISEVMNVIGDVKDLHCVITDDIIDSAGTICNAAHALIESGAASVRAYVTHGVFSPPALERIEMSALKEVVVTDSILATSEVKKCQKIRQISLSHLFGEAIDRINHEKSVSILFD
ncbi:MAG: ribose-phosphate pyrophosphokinase [Alphaproteobacteria bacterium]|jgi:ribose-phosphate pyrophosphokinase|nr:ribose-phosphate pyrophosphokinase [Alphaproteobacteria bacterium]MBP9777258.1 ribose-phosphate pyrophosphokinase [Alphaproteobacteria bacterium]